MVASVLADFFLDEGEEKSGLLFFSNELAALPSKSLFLRGRDALSSNDFGGRVLARLLFSLGGLSAPCSSFLKPVLVFDLNDFSPEASALLSL